MKGDVFYVHDCDDDEMRTQHPHAVRVFDHMQSFQGADTTSALFREDLSSDDATLVIGVVDFVRSQLEDAQISVFMIGTGTDITIEAKDVSRMQVTVLHDAGTRFDTCGTQERLNGSGQLDAFLCERFRELRAMTKGTIQDPHR